MSTRHYVSFLPGKDSPEQMATAYKRAPNLFGTLKRYPLYTLVNATGGFDLSPIIRDLEWHAVRVKKLVVMPEDKTFNGTNPAPQELKAYCLPNGTGGYTLIRWHPAVRDFFNRLILAIGEQCKVPMLQGIALQETSLGLNAHQRDAFGYSLESFADTYVDWINTANAALPKRPVFWHANFIAGDGSFRVVDDVMTRTAALGVTRLGGPDLWPTNQALVTRTYPVWRRWKLQGAGVFVGVSRPAFAQPEPDGGYMTMKEVLDFGHNAVGGELDNVFWVHVQTEPEPGSNDFMDAVPLIT